MFPQINMYTLMKGHLTRKPHVRKSLCFLSYSFLSEEVSYCPLRHMATGVTFNLFTSTIVSVPFPPEIHTVSLAFC